MLQQVDRCVVVAVCPPPSPSEALKSAGSSPYQRFLAHAATFNLISIDYHPSIPYTVAMAQFRPKKLDLGCFVHIMNMRDHTKRKVFEQHEPERYTSFALQMDGAMSIAGRSATYSTCTNTQIDKLFATLSVTPLYPSALARRPNSSSARCTVTPAQHKSRTAVSWAQREEVY
jgi:hypothetical protein